MQYKTRGWRCQRVLRWFWFLCSYCSSFPTHWLKWDKVWGRHCEACRPHGVYEYDLLDSVNSAISTVFDLIDCHRGQCSVAVLIKRPFSKHAVEILDREHRFGNRSSIGGVATRSTDIFDCLKQNIHRLVPINGIGLSQLAVLGFVICKEFLACISVVFRSKTSD